MSIELFGIRIFGSSRGRCRILSDMPRRVRLAHKEARIHLLADGCRLLAGGTLFRVFLPSSVAAEAASPRSLTIESSWHGCPGWRCPIWPQRYCSVRLPRSGSMGCRQLTTSTGTGYTSKVFLTCSRHGAWLPRQPASWRPLRELEPRRFADRSCGRKVGQKARYRKGVEFCWLFVGRAAGRLHWRPFDSIDWRMLRHHAIR